MTNSIAFGRGGRVRGEHQVPPLAFNHPPAGDKLPKVIRDFGQFARGCCILQHPLFILPGPICRAGNLAKYPLFKQDTTIS